MCFGRLDLAPQPDISDERYYVGRLGLSDEQSVPLLVDWRAPAAQRFYRATPARPDGVVRRDISVPGVAASSVSTTTSSTWRR